MNVAHEDNPTERWQRGHERPGHQDRAYASRIKRLRDRLAKVPATGANGHAVMAGMLDVLADLVADQEEAERAK